MSVYLNSNKVFFDAHTFFPSFQSIEFTLCNNLKSQCISSSDHGYQCLMTMMKQSTRKLERVSCALVAPFILRNSKALNYIMVHLNGLDIILDSLLLLNFPANEDPKEDLASSYGKLSECLKQKAVLCIKKILSFLNYKRNVDQINSLFDSMRKKLASNTTSNEETAASSSSQDGSLSYDVCFRFSSDGQKEDENEVAKSVSVKSSVLVKKSDYFGALLHGNFMEKSQMDFNNIQTIELKQTRHETFAIIVYMLGCGPECNSDYLLTFEQCYDLVMTCDQFILVDLRDFFISVLISKFLSLSTWTMCFKLAFYLNSSLLANACVDFLFSVMLEFPMKKSELLKKKNELETDPNDEEKMLVDQLADSDEESNHIDQDDYVEFLELFDYLVDGLKADELTDHLRKIFKSSLIDIIKNNYLKLY
jgi:hypothetical protein